MTDLTEHDAQLLRSAQQALESIADVFKDLAEKKARSAGLSAYAEGWVDALRWATREAGSRAKALGSLRGE